MIRTKTVVFTIIILIVMNLHMVESKSFQQIGSNQIPSTSASFWPSKRLGSLHPSSADRESANGDLFNIPKANEPVELTPNDQPQPHITETSDSTKNDDFPQSSGFWPDSKYVFKKRKTNQPNQTISDDVNSNTPGSNMNNDWPNGANQSSDDTANQAIFIHYSGTDKHKFPGTQVDQAGPEKDPNAVISTTMSNAWPQPTDNVFVPNPATSIDNQVISEKEVIEIQKKLSNGFLGVRGIDPVILRLLQITPEEFDKEFGILGSLPLPRDNE